MHFKRKVARKIKGYVPGGNDSRLNPNDFECIMNEIGPSFRSFSLFHSFSSLVFFFVFNFIPLSTSLWPLVMPGNFCDRELLGHGITFCPAESRRTNVPFSPVNAAELKRAAGSPLDHILSGFIDPASAGESQTANSFRVARPMPITAILPIKVVSVDNRDVFPRFLPILLHRLDPRQPGRSSWKNITFSTKRVITRSNEKWKFSVTMFHLAFPSFFLYQSYIYGTEIQSVRKHFIYSLSENKIFSVWYDFNTGSLTSNLYLNTL